ncbi:hypothetical protein [Sphingobacterium sp.]|uniref:hypothetical protein n=1 Tax=Sphingobacterium sp. TaxID=341027 RepID=UPI0028A0EDDA|nr:hypothetical protein [Sphingobacterium sp.]
MIIQRESTPYSHAKHLQSVLSPCSLHVDSDYTTLTNWYDPRNTTLTLPFLIESILYLNENYSEP